MMNWNFKATFLFASKCEQLHSLHKSIESSVNELDREVLLRLGNIDQYIWRSRTSPLNCPRDFFSLGRLSRYLLPSLDFCFQQTLPPDLSR